VDLSKKIELLLSQGVSVNSSASARSSFIEGMTPLMVAVQDNHIEVVELLLARNADVNARYNGSNRNTALSFAIVADKLQIVEILLKHGGSRSKYTILLLWKSK
jgi:ankyrin repeat protein